MKRGRGLATRAKGSARVVLVTPEVGMYREQVDVSDQEQQSEPQPDPLLGQLVTERYRIVRKIGEGGMGTVYEAYHEAIEKKIALKVLHAEYSSSPDVVSRFKQEAVSASRMKHQNVIDVFDFGQLQSGACFIAMEFLEGMDLGEALSQRSLFPAEHAIRIAVQIARALGLGHSRGVIHRDLKPENVFLQRTPEGDEVVKIVDFGIAQLRNTEEAERVERRVRRLTKTGMIFGTPEYMAPEQARGQDVDQRSDIYALGIIVYEMLSGALPFVGNSFLEILNQHSMAQPPPLSQANPQVTLSPELSGVVMKALEKAQDDRYPTMQAFSTALLRTPEGRQVRARISSFPEGDRHQDDAMRLENQSFPSPSRGAGTAVLGSSGSAPLRSETRIELPHNSSRGLVVGVAFAALLLLGLGAYAWWSTLSESGQSSASPEPSETQTDPLASADGSRATPDSVEPAPREPADNSEENAPTETTAAGEQPAFVVLSVETVPSGAVIRKDGFQVCDASPCQVQVEPGVGVVLQAELGSRKGTEKVLPQSDQSVRIQLVAPTPRPAPAPARPAPAPQPAPSPAMCEVMVDGLKILRPCQ